MKKVLLLGSTGSIGGTVLRAIEPYKDEIELCGATGFNNLVRLKEIKEKYHCPIASTKNQILSLLDRDYDLVINAISGTAGFEYSVKASQNPAPLALANKETIVLGGSICLTGRSPVIPLDSEHSAIDSLIKAHGKDDIDKILITASGGPFLGQRPETLSKITPQIACKHPTWSMGKKISIDSATLANKALEVFEAQSLFNLPIEVVVHPQSIVHSMVLTKSGQVYAQLSPPDMVFPIASAITRTLGVEQKVYPAPVLDFRNLDLHFECPSMDGFIGLAMDIKDKKQSLKAGFLVSDEMAVEAFCNNAIGFNQIYEVVEKTIENLDEYDLGTPEDCLECLEIAKEKAYKVIYE